jgi:hypothetical protein
MKIRIALALVLFSTSMPWAHDAQASGNVAPRLTRLPNNVGPGTKEPLCIAKIWSIYAFSSDSKDSEFAVDFQGNNYVTATYMLEAPTLAPSALQAMLTLLIQARTTGESVLVSYAAPPKDNPDITGIYSPPSSFDIKSVPSCAPVPSSR